MRVLRLATSNIGEMVMAIFQRNRCIAFVFAALVPGIALAAPVGTGTVTNGPTGAIAAFALPPSAANANNHGHFVCTAAIRSNGSVFSGEYVNPGLTAKLATGTYQVAFNNPCPDVRIAGGWFRIAQPDTLTIGSLPAQTCIVADRFGVTSAIWVQCFNAGGALVDTSFTLHVSR